MNFDLLFPFIHGIVLAFSLIMPAGIQNTFILNQSFVNNNIFSVMPVIITASLCDTILIVLSVLGISLILLEMEFVRLVILVLGFVFLLYIGYKMWKSSPIKLDEEQYKLSKMKQIIFTVSVSWLNPHAIIDTVVVIGSQCLEYSSYQKFTYSIGCIITTWFWFFSLAFFGNRLSKLKSSVSIIGKINKLSAVLMYLVAIYTAYQIFNIIL